jgi:hypothetical protein
MSQPLGDQRNTSQSLWPQCDTAKGSGWKAPAELGQGRVGAVKELCGKKEDQASGAWHIHREDGKVAKVSVSGPLGHAV